MGPSGTFARGAPGRRLLDLTSILLVAGIALLLPGTTVRGTSAITPSTPPAVEAVSAPAGTTPAPAVPTDGLALGVSASPRSICAFDVDTCAADAPSARVTLTASAVSSGPLAWPSVQVAFVVETTADDGVYDGSAGDPGEDSCAASTQVLCEESNGVPFFVANAPAIASAIAAANPDSQVTFAMVDYFANINNWDDGDGGEYHVDIPTFVSPSYFGSDVTSTFQATVLDGGFVYGDSDMADNQLTSSMITAMYGTIVGSGLDWSNNTHHVIVWMGSTAPRDPNYPEDYCVSWEDQYYASENGCIGATCEPSYTFTSGTSPNCEGWIRSQDGTATHSIASLAHTATQCTQSIGGDCTIDMIDLYDSNTDPLSPSWPAGDPGGGPGGILVEQDVDQTLLAGCDMAAATGGTWDGPAWFSCPDGSAGHLEYVPHGPAEAPNTENPTLFAAFRDIGFGPVAEAQEAADARRPLFEYVPFGPIVPTPDLGATAACVRAGVELPTCQQAPTVLYSEGRAYLGWNWSTSPSSNILHLGDYWTASFDVMATGPPYATVPVDACTTVDCEAAGSGPVEGVYSSAAYAPYVSGTVVMPSFPLAQVQVEVTWSGGLPSTAPPSPPAAPSVPTPVLGTLPPGPSNAVSLGHSAGTAAASVQAAAAGFLGAGFMRVALRNRRIALRVPARAGAAPWRLGRKGGVATRPESGRRW
jgi:hypothetical protein